ncbi:MAG: BON domain-containing protein [Gemmataceae bacterium]|nr:BON domain-containing protein [Gemmataceae bacterium]
MRKALSLLVVLAFFQPGCARQDKEHLNRIARKISNKVEQATEPTRKRFHQGWDAMRGNLLDATPEEAVRIRLSTDKKLHGEVIVVELGEGNSIVLKGAVKGEELRQRAIDLAESTQGVATVKAQFTDPPAEEKKETPVEKKELPMPGGIEKKSLPPVPVEPFSPFDPDKGKEKEGQEKPAPPLKIK